jgi:hypothetical protein
MHMAPQSAILERVINSGKPELSAELSRHILTLSFPDADRTQYQSLSLKAQDGTLSTEETAELDGYLLVNDLLTLLKSKARIALQQHSSAA